MTSTSVPKWAEAGLREMESILNSDAAPEAAARCVHIGEQLLAMDRQNVPVLFLTASAFMKSGQHGVAEHLFRRCIDMQPAFFPPYNNLGYICQVEGRRAEARDLFEHTLTLSPDNLEARTNLSSMLINNGTPADALRVADEILKDHPNEVNVQWNRALALLEGEDYERGWPAYRVGLELDPGSTAAQRKRRYDHLPYWNGLAAGRVVVYGEQGVGDEILGYSMLDDLIMDIGAENVILECHPRLFELARQAWGDHIAVYGTRKVAGQPAWLAWEKPDFKIPVLGLGEYYRASKDAFPKNRPAFMSPSPDATELCREILAEVADGRPLVGVSWSGGYLMTNATERSIPLKMVHDELLSVFRDEVCWVSLQYDPAENPGFYTPLTEHYARDTGINLHHMPHIINDLELGYGGLIHALDHVVSVNTSLVHACGAMGVPATVLTPLNPAWRYGQHGTNMPWYGDHVHLIRQTDVDDWREPFKRVRDRIREEVLRAHQ